MVKLIPGLPEKKATIKPCKESNIRSRPSGELNFRLMKKRGLAIASIFILLFIGMSCATTRKAHVEDKRRGLLMLEGEHIYKNKGFYNSKQSARRHKKSIKYHQAKGRY